MEAFEIIKALLQWCEHRCIDQRFTLDVFVLPSSLDSRSQVVYQ
jgi:hypothetical protein